MKRKFIWGTILTLVVWGFSMVFVFDKKSMGSGQGDGHAVTQSAFADWAGQLFWAVLALLLVYGVYWAVSRMAARRHGARRM